MQKSRSGCKNVALQVSGPHHVSAMEAFPAAAGVADRSAGPDGARSPGPQAGYGATPVPSPAFSPLNMAGPGKRRLPWAGRCCHCNFFFAFCLLPMMDKHSCQPPSAPPLPPTIIHPRAHPCATQGPVKQLFMVESLNCRSLPMMRQLFAPSSI